MLRRLYSGSSAATREVGGGRWEGAGWSMVQRQGLLVRIEVAWPLSAVCMHTCRCLEG